MTKAMTRLKYDIKKTIPFEKEIRFHPKLTFGEKVFLAEIIAMTAKGKCPLSCRQLSDLFAVSHQTISNWIKKLVKMGYLGIEVDYANEEHKNFLIAK